MKLICIFTLFITPQGAWKEAERGYNLLQTGYRILQLNIVSNKAPTESTLNSRMSSASESKRARDSSDDTYLYLYTIHYPPGSMERG
ncbi:hypothetical protein KP509_06G011100 [Ceratopteris richardii]|uniref:Secreted protein n=1 Tax=Ceratopteris richardii TaxID=49495 RepID=A0A8T2UE76_CERRI|nr:hypothetical protein KP509_06G011100 [Ceratopteris richardii]